MKKEFQLLSKDGETFLHCVKWLPENQVQPKAIFQIIHGMAEYILRYNAFASFLAKQGIMVIGHDHLGHGNSLTETNSPLGYFNQDQGANILIEDVHQLRSTTQKAFPTVPYFILGHSMGSFILRNYLGRYSEKLSGAIIMGTGASRSELAFALPLLKFLNKTVPYRENKLIDQLAFGSFSKHFPEKRTAFDWLSKSQENVDTYVADDKMGFIFTNNGFYTLFTLMAAATEANWVAPIANSLPILVISGAQDPVGNFGQGPTQVAFELEEKGLTDVTLHLYSDLRHELLNEAQSQLVMSDIFNWLLKRI